MKRLAWGLALTCICLNAFAQNAGHVRTDNEPSTGGQQLEGRLCTRGPDNRYKGTCFYDQQGNLTYWILRYWDMEGPSGKEIVGYPELAKLQESYNAMVAEVKKNQEGTNGALRDRWLHIAENYCIIHQPWMEGWPFDIPGYIPPLGELTEETIRIPYYMTFRKVLALWDGLLQDCTKRLGLWPFCDISIQKYVDSSSEEISRQFPRLFPLPPFKSRAGEIKMTVLVALEFDKALEHSLPREPYRSPCSAYSRDDVPKALSDRLAGIQRQVDSHIEQVQFLEELYRKSAKIEDDEDMERFKKKWGWTK